MTDNERDSPGVVAPPPLIYLVPLVLGLLLNGRLPLPFLPLKMTRGLGWPLLGSGVFYMDPAKRRYAGQPREAGAESADGRAVPVRSQPQLFLDGEDLHRDSQPRQRVLGHPLPGQRR